MSNLEDKLNQGRSEHEKAWGKEDWIVNNEKFNYCGKILSLKRGFQCSTHSHKIKSEVFYVSSGLVLMQAYNEECLIKRGESLLIEPGTKHRFIGITDAEIMEFSSFHREDDSHRETQSGKVPADVFTAYLAKYAGQIAECERD